MKSIFYIFIELIINLLTYIVPKKKNLVLFGSNMGNCYDRGNPKYVYEYLINNKIKELDYYWITRNKEDYKKLKEERKPVIYIFSIKWFIKILRANFLLIDINGADVSLKGLLIGNFKILQTWHGTPMKKIGLFLYKEKKPWDSWLKKKFNNVYVYILKKIYKNYILLVPSKEVFKLLNKAFESNKHFITGSPRNDVLLDKKLQNKEIKKRFKNKKIILYAPTFREVYNKDPFTKEELNQLEDFCLKNNYLFLIKQHYLNKFKLETNKNFKNIKDVSKKYSDIQQILPFVDILISDYSSVIHDFSILNKPFIFYCYDYKTYSESREFMIDFYKELPGPFVYNFKELFNKLNSLEKWFKNKDYQKKYQLFRKDNNKYLDSNSSKRVADFIIKQIEK